MTGSVVLPFQGEGLYLAIHPPRALPWAKLLRPFQGKGENRNFKTGAAGLLGTCEGLAIMPV